MRIDKTRDEILMDCAFLLPIIQKMAKDVFENGQWLYCTKDVPVLTPIPENIQTKKYCRIKNKVKG